jgi:hypothetical protein
MSPYFPKATGGDKMGDWLDPGNNPMHYLEVLGYIDTSNLDELGLDEYTLEIVNDIPHSLQHILTQIGFWQQVLFDYFDCDIEEL